MRSEPPRSSHEGGPGRCVSLRIPAMTDFRAKGTIMGPTGLTAVFGMGTGVAPPVWSPEMRPPGGQAAAVAFAIWNDNSVVDHAGKTGGTSSSSSEWTPTAADRQDP